MAGPEIIETGYAPIKAWIEGVPVEDAARRQLLNVAALPFIHHHVAVMPDVHFGMGATVGSVIPTKGAIIPAAVGVDIGCGMMAVRTTLTANDLPDNLRALRGRDRGGGAARRHRHQGRLEGRRAECGGAPVQRQRAAPKDCRRCRTSTPRIREAQSVTQLGTLGGGNHFIEVCLDEADRVWVMLHSGSRGIGNRIGTYFIEAREALERRQLTRPLPDQDLACLQEGEPLFDDYVEAVGWAQDYARAQPRGDDGGDAARAARAAAAVPARRSRPSTATTTTSRASSTSARTCG